LNRWMTSFQLALCRMAALASASSGFAARAGADAVLAVFRDDFGCCVAGERAGFCADRSAGALHNANAPDATIVHAHENQTRLSRTVTTPLLSPVENPGRYRGPTKLFAL